MAVLQWHAPVLCAVLHRRTPDTNVVVHMHAGKCKTVQAASNYGTNALRKVLMDCIAITTLAHHHKHAR